MFLRISFPGTSSSRSLIWVMINDLSLSISLNLIDPSETQNKWINLFTQFFFTFFNIPTGDLTPVEDKLMPITFFLTFRMVFVSFRLENLTTNLFGSLLGNHWQPSMLEEAISTSHFRVMSSISECSNYSRRPLNSRHSRLEYWELLLHCRSNETICFLSFGLNFLETQSWLLFFIILPGAKYLFFNICQGGIKLVLIFQRQSNYFVFWIVSSAQFWQRHCYLKATSSYLLK